LLKHLKPANNKFVQLNSLKGMASSTWLLFDIVSKPHHRKKLRKYLKQTKGMNTHAAK